VNSLRMGPSQQHRGQPTEVDTEYRCALYLLVVQYVQRVSCPLFYGGGSDEAKGVRQADTPKVESDPGGR
jgi:hypothetical protein